MQKGKKSKHKSANQGHTRNTGSNKGKTRRELRTGNTEMRDTGLIRGQKQAN